MKILALDLGTKTGWAVNQPPNSGVQNFALGRGESPGMRYLKFGAWLRKMLASTRPDLVVHEQAHHRGGAATEVAAGFVTHLQSIVAELGYNLSNVHTATIKRHATGKGNANKEAMVEAFKKRFGYEPLDDNEADACWLLDYAGQEFGGEDDNGSAFVGSRTGLG